MAKKLISPPVDLCLYFPPRAKGTPKEADCHTLKWSALIAREEYVAVRGYADEVYWAVAAAKSDCPTVKDQGDSILLYWENQGRSLLVKVSPGSVVQFSMGSDSGDPLPLQTVTNLDQLEETLFKLGRYVSGRKESECLPRRQKA